MAINGSLMQAQSLSDHDGAPAFGSQKDGFNAITLPPVTCRIVKTLKFNFLLRSDEYFHGMKA